MAGSTSAAVDALFEDGVRDFGPRFRVLRVGAQDPRQAEVPLREGLGSTLSTVYGDVLAVACHILEELSATL